MWDNKPYKTQIQQTEKVKAQAGKKVTSRCSLFVSRTRVTHEATLPTPWCWTAWNTWVNSRRTVRGHRSLSSVLWTTTTTWPGSRRHSEKRARKTDTQTEPRLMTNKRARKTDTQTKPRLMTNTRVMPN